jgi:hypothetical protein
MTSKQGGRVMSTGRDGAASYPLEQRVRAIAARASRPSVDEVGPDEHDEETRRFNSAELSVVEALRSQRVVDAAPERQPSRASDVTIDVAFEDLLPDGVDLAPLAPRPITPEPEPSFAPTWDRIAMAWRESNLARKPVAFERAHGLLVLAAVVVGFAVSVLCLMAVVGPLVDDLAVHAGIAGIVALAVPAVVARRLRPKDDPLIAIGLTTETYALVLLGFAVAFVVAGHDGTSALLAREGDRAAERGALAIARAEWFLARAER